MMLRFQDAFKAKYMAKRGLKSYGLKDEGNTMSMLRGQITSSLASYKRKIQKTQAGDLDKQLNDVPKSSNPLAAVLSLARKKKEEEALKMEEEGFPPT